MNFLDLCKRVATNEHISEIIQCDEDKVPYDIKQRVDALCDIMRNKLDILNNIEIPFIEAAFSDMERAEKLLSEYNDGDVPDYLLKELSTRLYHENFHELDVTKQSIIKTLSAYICISIQGSNN